MPSDVYAVVDFVGWLFVQYWTFCMSHFWTAFPITIGLVSFVWKLIKKVFR